MVKMIVYWGPACEGFLALRLNLFVFLATCVQGQRCGVWSTLGKMCHNSTRSAPFRLDSNFLSWSRP